MFIIEMYISMLGREWKPFVLKAVKDNWFVIAEHWVSTGQTDLSHPPARRARAGTDSIEEFH